MTTAQVGGVFPLVYLLYNTIGNVETQDRQVQCFANAVIGTRTKADDEHCELSGLACARLTAMPEAPSLNNRRFRDATDDRRGDVGADTVFSYQQEPDGVVHARYEGGTVRLGFLVGTRTGDDLEFRYSHVTTDGGTASGRCESHIEILPDGRLRMQERWEWTSKLGSGTSAIEEISPVN